jgi:hypothetical protein
MSGERPAADSRHWDDIVAEGIAARRRNDASQWLLGDLANEVTVTYGGKELERYACEIGVVYKTLLNWRTIAASIESSRRRENLSFTHHAVVVGKRLPDDAVDALLSRAEERRWPVRELELQVQAAEIRCESDRRRKAAEGLWPAPRRRAWSEDLDETERFVSVLNALIQYQSEAKLTVDELAALVPAKECVGLYERVVTAAKFLLAFGDAWKPYAEGESATYDSVKRGTIEA